MCIGSSRRPARSSSAATFSSPASPRRNASSAKLSRTTRAALILRFLQCFLFRRVLGPLLGERLAPRPAFEDATQTSDRVFRHWLEQDPLRRGLHNGARAILDVELA